MPTGTHSPSALGARRRPHGDSPATEPSFARLSGTDHNLLVGKDDGYTHAVQVVEPTGKAYCEYPFVVSDGTHETVTDTVRGAVERVNADPVRLSVGDGEVLSSTKAVSAAWSDCPPQVTLAVDGAGRALTTPLLASAPMFTVVVTASDDRSATAATSR